MAGQSTYLRNKILDAIFNAAAYSVATPYLSLHTGDPGITGANEVAGGSYARKLAPMGAAAAAAIESDAAVEFAGMPGATVTYVGVWDAVSGGNFLWGGALVAPVVVNAGNVFRFPLANVDASLAA